MVPSSTRSLESHPGESSGERWEGALEGREPRGREPWDCGRGVVGEDDMAALKSF